MKFLDQPVARMYVTTVLLLILVAGVASYFLKQFPYSIITAVVTCSLIEMLLTKFYFKRKQRFPFSAIITGFIIGGVAATNAPILVIIAASAIAILSKSFIRYKGSNIFNPAVLGLLVVLSGFGIGADWWIAGTYSLYGVLISLAPILAIAAYDARRLYAGLSFAAASFVIALLLSNGLIGFTSPAAFITILISVNYFLAFIMVSEPKTSPIKLPAQLVYGIGLAVLVSMMLLFKIPYAMLLALFLGNIAYLAYRAKSGSR